jgi:hypothetical protein
MQLTRSFKELVQHRVATDPAFGKELIASLTETCEHAESNQGRVRAFDVEAPDGRAVKSAKR